MEENSIKTDTTSLVYPNLQSVVDSYFITITLKPEIYDRRIAVQYSMSMKPIVKLLKQYTDKCLLCPELTKKCNVHYHAIVKWTRRVDYPMLRMLNDIKKHRIIGSIYVTENAIANEERAKASMGYMLEDYYKTRAMLQLPEILFEWEFKEQITGHMRNLLKKNEGIEDTDIDKMTLEDACRVIDLNNE